VGDHPGLPGPIALHSISLQMLEIATDSRPEVSNFAIVASEGKDKKGHGLRAMILVASMILVALMNWVRLPAQAPLFLRHSTRCFRMFSHQPDPPGPQWSAVQQALRVPRVILCCSLSQLIALSLRLHCCRFMRTNWTRVGENLPNLLRIKRLRRSASCG
jgi:hypothetical protein